MTIVAFEGIDGAGKTTLAHMVKDQAKHYGYRSATIYTHPYEPGKQLPESFDRETDWPVWAMNYLTQMHKLSLDLKTAYPSDLIILDRWHLSTSAYAPATLLGRKTERIKQHLVEACKLFYDTQIVAPDLWVFCKTNPQSPLRRPPKDNLDKAEPGRRKQIAARYHHMFNLDPYTIRLDTENTKPEACVETIFRHLKPTTFTHQQDEEII